MFVIILLPITVVGLKLSSVSYSEDSTLEQPTATSMVNACPHDDFTKQWGLWIDGRDAKDGPNAYGERFTNLMKTSHQKAAQLAQEVPAEIPLNTSHWTYLMSAVGGVWRNSNNPTCSENCASVLTSAQIEQFHFGLPRDYCGENDLLRNRHSGEKIVSEIFATYNQKRSLGGDGLVDIAWLMRNLAYLHPLRDRNSRSREVLLNFELRRQGISCGAMMFNYGKDIYFETWDTYVEKLQEGVVMYRKAQQSNFSINPWTDNYYDVEHRRRFPQPDALKECWRGQPCQHHQVHRGCRGTALSKKIFAETEID